VRCVAVYHFTVANNGFLRLGGASQTVATTYLGTSAFSAGIPQNATQTAYDETHAVKHAVVRIVSTAGATITAGAFVHNCGVVGATDPDATHGARLAIGDLLELWNSRDVIFNFSGKNLSGGIMELDVEVYE
jgi:hypothetical protein